MPCIISSYLGERNQITAIDGVKKEDLCIEAQERGKNFALIIKSYLFEGIFIDEKV